MRKSDMWTSIGGYQLIIGRSECGQIVVKLTPWQWEALPPWLQEVVVQIDILLAAQWAKENTTITDWRPVNG